MFAFNSWCPKLNSIISNCGFKDTTAGVLDIEYLCKYGHSERIQRFPNGCKHKFVLLSVHNQNKYLKLSKHVSAMYMSVPRSVHIYIYTCTCSYIEQHISTNIQNSFYSKWVLRGNTCISICHFQLATSVNYRSNISDQTGLLSPCLTL